MNTVSISRYATTRFFGERENATERKLRSFAALADGWNYGSGKRFEKAQIERAVGIYRMFLQLGISVTDAFPGLSGEISVTGYKDNNYIEYTLIDTDKASFVARKNDVVVTKLFRVNQIVAFRELVRFVGAIWNTSASSTQNTTTIGVAVGSIARLSVPDQTAAFQLWTAGA
jgi:hypothetical protein